MPTGAACGSRSKAVWLVTGRLLVHSLKRLLSGVVSPLQVCVHASDQHRSAALLTVVSDYPLQGREVCVRLQPPALLGEWFFWHHVDRGEGKGKPGPPPGLR